LENLGGSKGVSTLVEQGLSRPKNEEKEARRGGGVGKGSLTLGGTQKKENGQNEAKKQ